MNNVHESADVSEGAQIAESARIWNYAQLREGARVGNNCIIGRGVYVGSGVQIGNNCKIQNYALLFEPAIVEDGVFVGPGVVLTNDEFPRAVNPDGTLKSASDWQPVGVHIKHGASIGANTTCIAPLTIGQWALIGSGAVVTKDVPDFALVVGNPATRVGWVGKSGVPLKPTDENGMYVCPVSGEIYREISNGILVEVGEK